MPHPPRLNRQAHRRRRLALGAAGLTAAALAGQGLALAAPAPDDGLTPGQRDALDQGFQVAAKGSADQRRANRAPNPYLANLPDLTDADYFTWAKRMKEAGAARAQSASLATARKQATPQAAAAFVHDEQEPDGANGSNDTAADAERIPGFGTAASRNNKVRILGGLADLSVAPSPLATVPEDNGSIPLAGDTGIAGTDAVTTTGVLGDGPHGSSGTGTNDFDFYEVDIAEGLSLVADTNGSGPALDSVLAVYDAAGEVVAADDDGGDGFLSALTYTPDAAGTYYVMVGGFSLAGPLPQDPFDPASGPGGADEGPYTFTASVSDVDRDFFSVRLRPGDVVGGVGNDAATGLAITKPDGSERVAGVGTDASSLYPPSSPLPGGGNTTIAYVAEEAGWYAVEVIGAAGDYDVLVEGYRPGSETDRAARTQTVLLDFEGGRVNTGIYGGPGVRELSPFSAFVPRWGIARSQSRTLENRIRAEVEDNLQREVQASGLNPDVNVEVVTTRTNPELVGRTNVAQIDVSGTIEESGIGTIGIAQFIDPGNFGHEDQALVLLDVLSEPGDPADPETPPASLNSYLNASSNRLRFVSAAVGNVVAHEAGHTIGNYHTDNANDVHNVMDSGGAGFGDNLYGVGPDGIGGTADDEDIMFRTDVYSPVEGFSGFEDTLNVTAWAYAGR